MRESQREHPLSRTPLDFEKVRRLYSDERLTLVETAARLGWSTTTVRRRLHQIGVPIRSRGPSLRSWPSPFQATWSPEVAYAVGLIATDGNLSGDRRHLSVSSKDTDLLETLRRCLGLRATITQYTNGVGGRYYHVQWGDRAFYDWLVDIGLTPAKSLTIGALSIPDAYFADFARGCIDGDGSVFTYTDRYHAAKNARYVYERLYVTLVSGSRPFLEWTQATLQRLIGVHGSLETNGRPRKHPVWRLRWAKRESILLLRWIYYAPSVPCLARKRARFERFLSVAG